MEEEFSKEELWKIYKSLPEDLKETLFSPDTSEAIWNICKLCEINEVAKVAKYVGRVLMGLLAPENLKEVLKKELNLDEDTASKLDTYIQHYIFNPVADDLRELYHPEEKETEKEVVEEKVRGDIYREPIE
jgi:hypothetical protein